MRNITVKFGALLKRVGSAAYDAIIRLNNVVHLVRRRLGYGYWSLADWIKHQSPPRRALRRHATTTRVAACPRRLPLPVVAGLVRGVAVV